MSLGLVNGVVSAHGLYNRAFANGLVMGTGINRDSTSPPIRLGLRPRIRPVVSSVTVRIHTKLLATHEFRSHERDDRDQAYQRGSVIEASSSEYGTTTETVVPKHLQIDAVEIVTNHLPIHPDFTTAAGDHTDLRRHRTLLSYRNYGSDTVRWFDPSVSASDIKSHTQSTTGKASNHLGLNYWRITKYFGRSKRIYHTPMLTLVSGSTSVLATYRIWENNVCIPGYPSGGQYDWNRNSSRELEVPKAWANPANQIETLVKRTMSDYDMAGRSARSVRYGAYTHPAAIGIHWYSSLRRSQPPTSRVTNIDLGTIKPNHRIVIRKEM